MTDVYMKAVVPISEMTGDDDEDTELLKKQFARADAYIRSFAWCHKIKEIYFGEGVGGVVAVFLFRAEAGTRHVDEWFWIVTGDLPSCYMVTDDAPTPALALEGYCGLMEDWAEAVLAGESLEDVYPVDAPATEENAEALASRMNFIRENILPYLASYVEE
jgi:hypothetical protein